MLTRTITVLDRIAAYTGTAIAPLTFVMVILTCVVVVARYVLETGAVALSEGVMYLHGVVFMLGIGYTLKDQGHVRVDILYQRFSRKQRALVDLLGTLLFLLPFCMFVLWTSYDYVSLSWSMKEDSPEPGGLPGVFLLKTLIPLMALLLLLQGLADALRSIKVMIDTHG